MASGRTKKTRTRSEMRPQSTGATTGYESQLWQMADALRGSMDAAEHKHVVLGLIFLKYISDAFEERHAVLAKWGEDAAEDRDEYIAENNFWVPPEARWAQLKVQARQSTIGLTVNQAMATIERENPALKDVLPKDYARPALDKQRLGQLIDIIGNIRVGDPDARSRDVLGRVYEYFLSQFASAEGKKGAVAVRGARKPSETVMVSCIGSDMGKSAIAGKACVTNQQINSVVVESPNCPLFVYYNLSMRKEEIRAAAGGSAQPILNKSAFGQLNILLPTPPETARYCPHPGHAGRQDRAEPANERDARGDGPRPVQVLVRRFRSRAGQDGKPRYRPTKAPRRLLPRPARGLRTRPNPPRVGGEGVGAGCGSGRGNHAEHQGSGVLEWRNPLLGDAQRPFGPVLTRTIGHRAKDHGRWLGKDRAGHSSQRVRCFYRREPRLSILQSARSRCPLTKASSACLRGIRYPTCSCCTGATCSTKK